MAKKRWRLWWRAYVKEHHAVNTLWRNFHAVESGRLYRSAQPTPRQLEAWVRRYGIKTVINLRGRSRSSEAVYRLERAVCRRLGVRYVDMKLASRNPADMKKLARLKEVFERVEYPALIHCKAGADRSTLAAVLYRHWMMGESMEAALEKEARFWPYGYMAASKAGMIGFFLERFARSGEKDLLAWLEKEDLQAMRKAFVASRKSRLADWVFEKVLRRE